MANLLRRLRGRASSSKLLERLQQPSRIERVAFLGPVPPTATGIATYDRAVLDGLARIGFTRELPIDVVWPVDERKAAYVPAYRLGVYQLGNNVDFHLQIYRTAWQAPGLVVLHDLALDDFVRGLQSVSDPLGYVAVREALQARDRLRSTDAGRNEPLRTPWAAAIARRSRGIVVHSQFCRRYLEEFGCKTPIYVVPHPPVETVEAIEGSAARGRALRGRAEARGATALVVAVGDMNQAKRLDAVLRAATALDPGVHVALVGRKVQTFDVWPLVHASGLGDRVHVEQDVSDQDFLGWIHAADVVVDLRFPHRGEESGSLARAMQVGRPTVLSATGTYLDVPDGTAVHIASGPGRSRRARAAAADAARRPGPSPADGRDREGLHGRPSDLRGHRARLRRRDPRDDRDRGRPHGARPRRVGALARRDRGHAGVPRCRLWRAVRPGAGGLQDFVMTGSAGEPGTVVRLADLGLPRGTPGGRSTSSPPRSPTSNARPSRPGSAWPTVCGSSTPTARSC